MPTMFLLVFGGAILVTLLALAWAYTASARANSVPDDSEPVAIASGGEAEVAIMAGKLESAGIRSFTHQGGIEPLSQYGWEVLVRHADVALARRILHLVDH